VRGHHYRKEKKCLNCGAEVPDKFCTHCGQANTEPKESLFHLVADFFSDITHYDSKVFVTLKDLIFKPGFLTKEYNAGKRIRYLNPIRLYGWLLYRWESCFNYFSLCLIIQGNCKKKIKYDVSKILSNGNRYVINASLITSISRKSITLLSPACRTFIFLRNKPSYSDEMFSTNARTPDRIVPA
jgi:hypothetical protein